MDGDSSDETERSFGEENPFFDPVFADIVDTDSEVDEDPAAYDIGPINHEYLSMYDPAAHPSLGISVPLVEVAAGTRLQIPVFLIPNVLLPNQTIPLFGRGMDGDFVEEALKQKPAFVGALTCHRSLIMGDVVTRTSIGVLLRTTSFNRTAYGFTLTGVATQRFRMISKYQPGDVETGDETCSLYGLKKAEVEVLDEMGLLPPFYSSDLCSAFHRLPKDTRKKLQLNLHGVPAKAIELNTTFRNTCLKRLVSYLRLHFSEEQIQNALQKGLVSFGYWSALSVPANSERKLQLLCEDSVEQRFRMQAAWIENTSRLLVQVPVAEGGPVGYMFTISSEGIGTAFVNPHGYVHDFIPCRKMENVVPTSLPTAENSWFEGYEWTVLSCISCYTHPKTFYGIVRSCLRFDCPETNNFGENLSDEDEEFE
ncbi:Peptidase S16 domain containing protein [Aphelenchoides fujianensis]|nr:Peptidase S16 domain containing protein [Aphelenchoides fujianensis]